MSREAIEYRFAGYAERFSTRPFFTVRVPGGHVGLAFYKEVDWEEITDATYVNYVTEVSTCDALFRLPDGVVKGTSIPFSKKWRRYTFGYGGAPAGPLWQTRVRVRGLPYRVRLHMLKGHVDCIDMSRVFG